jgi:hypothetical protein
MTRYLLSHLAAYFCSAPFFHLCSELVGIVPILIHLRMPGMSSTRDSSRALSDTRESWRCIAPATSTLFGRAGTAHAVPMAAMNVNLFLDTSARLAGLCWHVRFTTTQTPFLLRRTY